MDAITFVKEKNRLTQNCDIQCEKCRLQKWHNGMGKSCAVLAMEAPEIFVSIIEQWSKDCPQET